MAGSRAAAAAQHQHHQARVAPMMGAVPYRYQAAPQYAQLQPPPAQPPPPTLEAGAHGNGFTVHLPDAYINQRLLEREQARATKDFAQGDQIREELLQAGVKIDDGSRTWACTDGRSGVRPNAWSAQSDVPNAANHLPSDYIAQRLLERELARAAKDFTSGDQIREELQQAGVSIDDGARTWRCADGRSGARPNAVPL
eukprot:6482236-Prymnesium_polylepis.1